MNACTCNWGDGNHSVNCDLYEEYSTYEDEKNFCEICDTEIDIPGSPLHVQESTGKWVCDVCK